MSVPGWGLETTFGLAALIAFVGFEFGYSRKSLKDGYTSQVRRVPSVFRIPPIVFGIIWFIVKALMVAAFFLFVLYSNSYAHYTYVVGSIMFFILTVASKLWMPLFFTYHQRGISAILAVVLAAHAIVVTIMMGLQGSQNSLPLVSTYIRWIPVICMSCAALWYVFAVILNLVWWMRVPFVKTKDGHRVVPADGTVYMGKK
jgi:tryptophan-rich sensory protein